MSLAKLTSLSTQTLSLLLERQRLHTIPSTTSPTNANANSLHIPKITRNLRQLRKGILDLEEKDGQTEAVRLLRSQYERMRGMLGKSGEGIESLADDPIPSSSSPTPPARSSSPSPSHSHINASNFAPYTDEPDGGASGDYKDDEPEVVLQTQKRMIDEQDLHLDNLSNSISRQHHISLQIGSELDVHSGLLEELDTDLDQTEGRLTGARRRLDKVAKGAKENGSTVMIAILILVLLILIIVFKT